MALWTPADLTTPPLINVWGPDATFPSGVLSWPNPGTGADVTKNRNTSSPAAGTAINGLQSVGFGSGVAAEVSLPTTTAGSLWIYAFLRPKGYTSNQTLLSKNWCCDLAYFIDRPGGKSENLVNVFSNPYAAYDNFLADTNPHGVFIQLGPTIVGRKDGSALTVGADERAGTAPSWAANSYWEVGCNSNGTGEFLNADLLALVYGDTELSSGDYEKLEGWAHWQAGLASTLPSGHPYKSAAPTTGGGSPYTLAAGVGAFALSGQTSGFTAARSLSAAVGAVSVSGQSAGCYHGYAIPAAVGGLVLGGQTAGLVASRVLGAATGVFALAGQNAGLTRSGNYIIRGDAAVYVSAGKSVNLTYAPLNQYALTAAAGSFALSGTPATMTYSGAARWQSEEPVADLWTTAIETVEIWTPQAASLSSWSDD